MGKYDNWFPESNASESIGLDDILIFLLYVGILVFIVAMIYVLITSPSSPDIPLTCGVTEENHSESYIYGCGKTSCISYHHDLVCTNGTTILKWRH